MLVVVVVLVRLVIILCDRLLMDTAEMVARIVGGWRRRFEQIVVLFVGIRGRDEGARGVADTRRGNTVRMRRFSDE